jgi:hypothetical protein
LRAEITAFGLLVCLGAAIAPAPAAAQPAGAQAETLFRRGKELMAQGQFAEACAAFDASQKLDPTSSTLINRAYCREKNAQLATAWGLFLEAERQTRTATDAPGKQLHRVAVERAASLEPRLSTLKVVVPAESRVGGLEILRDGEPIDAASWNQALPIDGGAYTVTARAPGNAEWSTSVKVGVERDVKTIEIPRLKPAVLSKDAVPLAAPAAEPTERRRSQVVPLVLAGSAVALLGGALAFHLSGESTYDEAKKEPDPVRQDDLWHSANTKRYVAEGLGAAGIVCGGVAVWLYLHNRAGDAAPARASALTIDPVLGNGRAGITLGGTF